MSRASRAKQRRAEEEAPAAPQQPGMSRRTMLIGCGAIAALIVVVVVVFAFVSSGNSSDQAFGDPNGVIAWRSDGEQPDARLREELERAANG